MLILFEGVDKSGKSTLLNNFKNSGAGNSGSWKNFVFKPNSTVFSQGKIEGLYLGFYEAAKEMSRGRYPFLLDRSHITEIAYAPVKRNYSPDHNMWLEYEKTLDAIVVYVETPVHTILERIEKLGDDYVREEEEIRSIGRAYATYLSLSSLPVIVIDGSKTEEEMLQSLCVKLDEYLRKRYQSGSESGSTQTGF